MTRQKSAPVILADDNDDGKVALGCLGALVVVTVIGVAIALFGNFDSSPNLGDSASGDLPITRVEAMDKQQASGSGPGSLLARNLEAGDQGGAVAGRSGVLVDLVAQFYEHGIEPEILEREMLRRSVCYNGRPARIVPLVLTPDSKGFALAFGAPSFNEGDPFPRIEFFHGIENDLEFVYFVSMTHEPVRGFSPMGERIPNTRKDVGRVMLKWVAEVANSACPMGGS